jgi:periplasmic protein TonB
MSRAHRPTNSNTLLPYFLTSALIHGLAALVITHVERSQPVTKQKQDSKPIEFVIVPPKETPDKPPPETKRRAINNSVAQGKIKSEKSPTTEQKGSTATDSSSRVSELKVKPTEAAKPISPEAPEPKTVEPTEPRPIPVNSVPTKTASKPKPAPSAEPTLPKKADAVEPIPPAASKPKPVEPTQPRPISANSLPAKKASEPRPTSSGEPTLPQKSEPNAPVATRLAPQPKSPQSTPTPSSNSSAASLLGGSYERSIQDDSGNSFFNLQANASKEAPYAQIEAQQDALAPYFAEIRRRIKLNWQPESPQEEQLTVLNFAIQRNGQITGLRVAETSGEQQVDQDALEAVQKSAPFDILPQSFKRDRLEIQFSFNIYIHQGSF